MKIYLAGPMSGIAEHNFPAFDAAAEGLRWEGNLVYSPADMSREVGKVGEPTGEICTEDYAYCMRMDLLCILQQCDTVYVLPGWRQSKGARLEILVAQVCGIPVYEYETRELLLSPAIATVSIG